MQMHQTPASKIQSILLAFFKLKTIIYILYDHIANMQSLCLTDNTCIAESNRVSTSNLFSSSSMECNLIRFQ